ncbi:MAG: outer membrane protein assembly factor BamE [Hyphomicrobiaceae bacterium]
MQSFSKSRTATLIFSLRRTARPRMAGWIALLATAFIASACGQNLLQTHKHGHQFRSTDAQLIQPGMSQEDVRLSLGTPTTISRKAAGSTYYYISSTTQQLAFWDPHEVDRKVFAVYFDELGGVDKVASYGLKDGRVFDFISRTTPAANQGDSNVLKAMFKNLGKGSALSTQ